MEESLGWARRKEVFAGGTVTVGDTRRQVG